MAEYSSKPAVALVKRTLKFLEGKGRDWVRYQIQMMNPKKMSPADIDFCKDILEGF